MNLVEAMTIIADKYHNKVMQQKRKYTGEPYTVHTDEVEAIYATHFPDDMAGRGACKGHDLFEDTPIRPDGLRTELLALGIDILTPEVDEMIGIIIDLTDVYTKEAYPKLNRAERKRLERERIGKTSVKAKTAKLCDLISNTRSIVSQDKDFARVYLKEKFALLPYLADGSPVLLQEATVQTLNSFKEIGIDLPVYGSLVPKQ